jgi:hypothetical protein
VGDGGGVKYNRLWSLSGLGWVDNGSEVVTKLEFKTVSIALETNVKIICPARIAGMLRRGSINMHHGCI